MTDDVKTTIEALHRAFDAFKAERSEEIAEVKKGFADVVKAEKVDRISAEITALQAAVDEHSRAVAAMQVGAGGSRGIDPAKAAHAKAFDRFFRKGAEADLRDLEVKAALSTSSDPDGGYVVPEQMETAIDRVLGTVSAMRSLARVISLSAPVYKKLVKTTGADSGWVGEPGARPETDSPRLSVLEFPVMEVYANPATTQTLLDDSRINIEQWLADEVSIEFAEQEGAAFISGDGVAKPRGIMSYDPVANASWSWGKVGFVVTGAAADFNSTEPANALIDLLYSLKSGYRGNAVFLMNDTLQSKVMKFQDANDHHLWQPSLQAGQPATLLGKPVVTDDNMPDVGAGAFPVAFGDFRRAYVVVDRVGIRVLRDPYTNKPYVMFYTTKRVGGGVQNFEAYKLLKCST